MRITRIRLIVIVLATALSGCAARIVPDPRMPAPAKDAPVLLTVCYLEGDGAHLRVGDQVELANSKIGRLRIRHIPASGNNQPAWNGGDSVRVRTALLAERVDPSGQNRAQRRFIPVGQFKVEVAGQPGHGLFDFVASKATANLSDNRLAQCNLSLGDDEVLVRGLDDDARHGGVAHLR
jgi:hypothetical protein